MHPYATDSNERRLVPCLLALLSLIAALVFGKLLEYATFTVPWWFDSPAVIGFYGIFYRFFEKSLWKLKILRKMGIVKLLNLNGTWKGYVISSYDEHAKKYEATFTIKQDWNKISIVGRFEMSVSYSLTASILVNDRQGITVNFDYMNEPSTQAVRDMEIHRGFNSLTLKPNAREMSGAYYSGRGRQNTGEIKLEKM